MAPRQDPIAKARRAAWDAQAAGQLPLARQHFQTGCAAGDGYACGMAQYIEAEQAQQTGNAQGEFQARSAAVKTLYSGCLAKNAMACSVVATEPYLTAVISDAQRGTIRKAVARMGAQLYAQGCVTSDITVDCLRLASHVRAVRNIDSRMPEAERSDGLVDFTSRAADVFVQVCDIGPQKFAMDCLGAIQMLDVADKPRATKVREVVCNENLAFACHDLGRLSAAELQMDQADQKACNGGSGVACGRQALFWYGNNWAPQRLDRSRAAARKGCDLNYAEACMMWGQFVASGEGGAADVPAGLAAFDKACSLAGSKSSGCRYATLVRKAIAEGKQIRFR